ncbi:MAG: tetratricopeptide repeat protein [Planctomycetota bacterium]
MRKSLLLGLAFLTALPLACQKLPEELTPDLDQYPPEFLRVMDASERVLERHFIVTGVDKVHGVIDASSVVRANVFTKYRTRAEARVYPVGKRVYDVQIRVTNELEVSEPSMLGRGQPGFDWRAVGFDHVLEAALMTEVQAELQGETVSAVPPGYNGFLKPSAPKARHRDLFKPPAPKPKPKAEPQDRPPPAEGDAEGKPKPQNSADLYEQYIALGDVYEGRREHKKALLEYQRAALARDDAAAPHLSLATVLTALSRYDAAAAALRDAARSSGDQALSPKELGRLKGLAQDLDDRLLALQGWLKQNPKDGDAHLVLGYHYLLADRAEEAREALHHVRAAQPKDPAARFLLTHVESPES